MLFGHIIDVEQSWDACQKKLRLVLGIGSRDTGIRNYRFEQLDIDVFGGTYERFLAEQQRVRKARGIYYTPEYVTDYIVYRTVVPFFDHRIGEIRDILESPTPDQSRIDRILAEITDFKVCDIACGSGSFLTQAFSYIWEKYHELGEYLKAKAEYLMKRTLDQQKLLEAEDVQQRIVGQLLQRIGFQDKRRLIASILLRHVFGNDIDRRATDVAKLNLWLEAIRLSPEDFKHDLLPATASFILPNLELNLNVGDSILGLPLRPTLEQVGETWANKIRELNELRQRYLDDPTDLESIKKAVRLRDELNQQLTKQFNSRGRALQPLHHPLIFWPAFFDSDGMVKTDPGFHAVLGNPPYGREQTDAAKEIMNYKSPIDTYTIFMERALELLRSDGRLGYIVPVSWQTAPDFQAFRSHVVREKFVENVVDLPFDTFKDAYVDCGIVVIGNWKSQA